MDFELSEDQVALQEGVAALLAGRFDLETVRGLEGTAGVDRALWSELAEAGVFGLALAEHRGGVGLGHAEAAVVYEQLGMSLIPGPIIGTFVAGPLVDGAVSGDRVVGLLAPDAHPAVIENFDALDDVLVVTQDRVERLDPAALNARAMPRSLDPLTSVHALESVPSGEQVGGAKEADLIRKQALMLASAIQLGLAGAATELAVAYAKERQQFNKPIGAFQAVKHICSDMVTRLEVARSAVYAAAVNLDDDTVGEINRSLAVAKLLAGEAATENAKGCIQVHGGMGYTWEVPAHLFLKRSWLLDSAFGDADLHAEAVAASL